MVKLCPFLYIHVPVYLNFFLKLSLQMSDFELEDSFQKCYTTYISTSDRHLKTLAYGVWGISMCMQPDCCILSKGDLNAGDFIMYEMPKY